MKVCLLIVALVGSIFAKTADQVLGQDSIVVEKRYLVAEFAYLGKPLMPVGFDSVPGFPDFLESNPEQKSNFAWSRGIARTTGWLNIIGCGILVEETVRYLATGHASKALIVSGLVVTVPISFLGMIWSNSNELSAVDAFNASKRQVK